MLEEEGSFQMLSTLADQIVTQKLNQEEINSVRYWTLWKAVLDRALVLLGSLSERVHIVFDTKIFKFEVGKPNESEKAQSAPSTK